MSRPCPIYGKAIYMDCLDCEEKYCRKQPLCTTCIHRIKIASNYRCEFTYDAKNKEHSMRYTCSKYERRN